MVVSPSLIRGALPFITGGTRRENRTLIYDFAMVVLYPLSYPSKHSGTKKEPRRALPLMLIISLSNRHPYQSY